VIVQTLPVIAGLQGSFSEIVKGLSNFAGDIGLFAEFQRPLIVG